MMQAESDPWLALLHAFRKQTGIQPIPLSDAERESGLLAAFSSAAPTTTPHTVPQRQPAMEPEPIQHSVPREARHIVLRRIRETLSDEMRAMAKKINQPTLQPPAESNHTDAPPSASALSNDPSKQPKRYAMHLAAYKKTTQ